MSDYIFGRRNATEFIEQMINSGKNPVERIRMIYAKEKSSAELKAILGKLKGVPVKEISRKDLDEMVLGKNHQGIILETISSFKPAGYQEFLEVIKKTEGLVLILDRIQDAGNLGAILRTAECMGVSAVVIPERESVDITDTVTRISSGAVHYLKIFRVTNLRQCLEPLKKQGYWIIAADETGTEQWDLPLGKLAVVMGNEKDGIKRILLEESDYIVKIPLQGKISSLNVSVATGIILDRLVNR